MKEDFEILKGGNYTKLALRVDLLEVVRWWIDASYNTQDYCRGNTDIMMILGRGQSAKIFPEAEG